MIDFINIIEIDLVDNIDEFMKWGYYSKIIKGRNLRVIVLNCNACNIFNFRIYDNPTDPGD